MGQSHSREVYNDNPLSDIDLDPEKLKIHKNTIKALENARNYPSVILGYLEETFNRLMLIDQGGSEVQPNQGVSDWLGLNDNVGLSPTKRELVDALQGVYVTVFKKAIDYAQQKLKSGKLIPEHAQADINICLEKVLADGGLIDTHTNVFLIEFGYTNTRKKIADKFLETAPVKIYGTNPLVVPAEKFLPLHFNPYNAYRLKMLLHNVNLAADNFRFVREAYEAIDKSVLGGAPMGHEPDGKPLPPLSDEVKAELYGDQANLPKKQIASLQTVYCELASKYKESDPKAVIDAQGSGWELLSFITNLQVILPVHTFAQMVSSAKKALQPAPSSASPRVGQ